ncbi:hypothetical protein hrd7_29040 [Leptolinea sp. HRD-7]|nr:hypothetical protein hrd7_29040 [Leptolinea sp. HRD-7]
MIDAAKYVSDCDEYIYSRSIENNTLDERTITVPFDTQNFSQIDHMAIFN